MHPRALLLLTCVTLAACTDATGPTPETVAPAPTFMKACTVPGHTSGATCGALAQKALLAGAAMARICSGSGGLSPSCWAAEAAFADAWQAYSNGRDAYGHRNECDVYGVDCSGRDLRHSTDLWQDPEWNPDCVGQQCQDARDKSRDLWWAIAPAIGGRP